MCAYLTNQPRTIKSNC